MKKILLLGGSAQQIIVIETAKKMGYYTVLCDYLVDNPGQYCADKFYLVSTTDRNAVLKVAKDEHISGVLAYASDPAAPTAAYVAEQLGLPTNPLESVEILCNKDRFRKFLKENGFNTPVAKGYSDKEEALRDKEYYKLPVIVKPVDSSGSKGATVLHSWEDSGKAIDFAFSFSRSHRIIIEEFIEKKHEYLIGGDIFVVDGKVVLWGLLNCHRDTSVNPLVPVGKSYPLLLDQEDEMEVHNTLQRIIDRLHLRFGSVNVELVIDHNNRVWPIDIGPRAGGNMIPDLLGMIFGVDIAELSVKAAMGIKVETTHRECTQYYATHNLHSSREGIFETIYFSDEIKPFIIKTCIYKKKGDAVQYFDNASKALGIVFFRFETLDKMLKILSNVNKYIEVVLDETEGG